MVRYSQRIIWGGNTVEATGEDLAEVQAAAIRLAQSSGWTPRKWWQFWRWPEPSYSHLNKYL